MLMANTEGSASPFPATHWFPGKKLEGFSVAPLSARAIEIAKSREELLGLLQDLPESDYELSLTDLVERGSVVDETPSNDKNGSPERVPNRASSVIKERKTKRNSRSSGGGGSCEGVFLNVYVPGLLARSITSSRGRSRRVETDCYKRNMGEAAAGEAEEASVGDKNQMRGIIMDSLILLPYL